MKIKEKIKIPAQVIFFVCVLRVCIPNFKVLSPTLMDFYSSLIKVQARKIKLPLKFADSWSIFADEVMPITKIAAIALEREFHRASHNKC